MDSSDASFSRKRGYRRLAAAMAWDPSMAVFSRFRQANALNLLCLQSEIKEIELKLNLTINHDDRRTEAKSWSSDFDALRSSGKDSDQWRLFIELRALLEQYNRALRTQIIINDQPDPSQYDLKFLKEWLDSSHGGASALRGAGSDTWFEFEEGGNRLTDLVALNKSSVHASGVRQISSFILPRLARLLPFVKIKFDTFLAEEDDTTFQHFSTSDALKTAGDRLLVVFATILVLIPVVVLHFVTNPEWRLLLIVLFTLSFTTIMSFATEAKTSEIFVAAAGFVAVQVVYVGSV
ncbi:hypothetical protein AMS68_004407 [Peltaster fructicola]|uniref:DUF6594 domain-containing protein n=1 Tax=Peltaster fructicola TaxID=286661 RepID=A0A6H0XWS8_9PEZI|nr:hypothetical protein AMS68_004407 [Peltaster fructicola]